MKKVSLNPPRNQSQLRRVGRYPVDDFHFSSSSNFLLKQFPVQLFFAGSAQWVKGVECVRNNSSRCSIEYIKQGEFIYKDDETICTVREGDFIFLRPNITNTLRCESDHGIKYVIALSGSALSTLLEQLNLTRASYFHPTNSRHWEDHYHKAYDICKESSNTGGWDIATFAYSLLLELSEMNNMQNYPFPLQQALEFIHTNIHANLNLSIICAEINMSPSTLNRLFNKHIKATPLDYVRDQKLLKIAELLKTGKYSVKEISVQMQYASPQYLASEFKKKYNMTPKEFQQAYREF